MMRYPLFYAESCENLQNWKYPIFQVFWPQTSLHKELLVLDLLNVIYLFGLV
jgi:hypothetical protein